MIADLLLYAELLVFLSGTFLYGFLVRALRRDRAVLRGNLPLRVLALSLFVWYAGCLVDGLLAILVGETWGAKAVGTLVDIVRGAAWLLSFPLLAHTVWRMLPRQLPGPDGALASRPSGSWLVPGYATLALFAASAVQSWSERALGLADTARRVLPLFLVHSTVSSIVAAVMIRAALAASEDRGTTRFLRALLGALLAVVTLDAAGALMLRLGGGSPWVQEAWILISLVAGLALGVTFLYFVLRYNLLRLSLSWTSLRHFVAVIAVVVLAMAAAPAAGASGSAVSRRLIAWGLVVALVAGAWGSAWLDRLSRRFAWARRLFGRAVPPQALERLSRRIQTLAAPPEEVREAVRAAVSGWLDADARWLAPRSGSGVRGVPGGPGGADEESLWRHLEQPGTGGFTRLDAPSGELYRALAREDLHAAFPLRVGARLDAVLALAVSPTGGGYSDGEREAVELVLRQLGSALEVRELLDQRLQAERRFAERERLGMLGLVAASLAHELRNPLASIKALAQTVQEEVSAASPAGPAGEQARDLGVIVEQIDRLNAVAREILEFARPREGSDCDLAALVHSALYVLGQEARRRGITVDGAAIADVGRVQGTPATWQAVVFNLVLNALRHAPAGSTVRVGLAGEGEDVVFTTENGGEPIPAEVARDLFQPFVSTGGTGLGLAIVAHRLGEIGGAIDVDNQQGRIVFRVRSSRGRAPA